MCGARSQCGMQLRRDFGVDSLQETARVSQRLIQICPQGIERNPVKLSGDGCHARLQFLEAAGHGGQLERAFSPVQLRFRRLWEQVECDVNLAGQEISCSQLSPEPSFNHLVQQVPRIAGLGRPLAVTGTQSIGIQPDLNRYNDVRLYGIVVDVDRCNFSTSRSGFLAASSRVGNKINSVSGGAGAVDAD